MFVGLASALLLTATTGELRADGLNEWTGTPAAAGEVWFVPQGIISLGTDVPQGYYLQTQVGLAKGWDVIATPSFPILAGEFEEPYVDLYVRYGVADALAVTLGASSGLAFKDTPSAIVGLFHTLESKDEVWKFTWNALAWVPPTAPDETSIFGVLVLNRSLNDMWTAYAEVDVTYDVGNNVANVEAGFGLQLDFGDVDTLNFGFLAPLQPIVGSDAPVMISAWYAHGFNVKAD